MKTHKTNTRRWFNKWSNKYDQTLGRIGFHRGLLHLVVQSSGVKKGERVLDIGCGTGLLSLKFLQKKDCLVTGIDSSKEMMAIFQDKISRLALDKRVRCRLMDAVSLEFQDNTFDVAVSSVVLHHLQEKLKPLQKIYRILKPGGRFIIGEVDMDTTGSHNDPRRLKRILKVLGQEWIPALKDAGVEAFVKMFENGRKHILNEGEYCISLKQWAAFCRKAGFKKVIIKRVPHYEAFGIVMARKPANRPLA